MANATDKTVTVKFDPNSINLQTDIIGPATSKRAGVMTAAQAKKVDDFFPGGGETVAQTYDKGSSSADQTALIDPAKGGGIIAQAKAALAGRLLAALDSVGGVILDVIDAAIPKVLLAGAFIQNDPVFGSPVMGSQTPGNFMGYTADGIGAVWGGTGVTAQAQGGPASLVVLHVEDNAIATANLFGLETAVGKTIGIDGTGTIQPVDRIAGKLYHAAVGAILSIVGNAISPTNSIHQVNDGVISNINKPYPTFRGSITLIPIGLVGFTWNATGNIQTSGSTTPNVPVIATTDGTVWYIS